MSIKVKTPNANFEGEIAGVRFERGEAIFENEAQGRHVANMLGFEVVGNPAAPPRNPSKAKKESK